MKYQTYLALFGTATAVYIRQPGPAATNGWCATAPPTSGPGSMPPATLKCSGA